LSISLRLQFYLYIYLGDKPIIKYTADGKAIATLSVATSKAWVDKQSGEKKEVSIPASNLKSAIASVMQQEGYIESFSMTGEKATKTLTLKPNQTYGKNHVDDPSNHNENAVLSVKHHAVTLAT
jgi:hypothetical protein